MDNASSTLALYINKIKGEYYDDFKRGVSVPELSGQTVK